MTARTIWLASYPKSGNTWVRALLTGLEQGEALDINRIEHGAIATARGPLRRWLGMPSSDFTAAELSRLRPLLEFDFNGTFDRVHFRKIHDALVFNGQPIVSPAATLGAIYVVRDPRAVAVSMAHHLAIPFEESIRLMADPAGCFGGPDLHHVQLPQHLGPWSVHVRQWLDHDLFPVLLVRYEDLHADPIEELTRVAAFAGLEVSEEAILVATRAAGFDRLSAQEAAVDFREGSGNAMFFRQGEVAGWRNELPEELVRRVEADHAETMAWLGYAPAVPPSERHDSLAAALDASKH